MQSPGISSTFETELDEYKLREFKSKCRLMMQEFKKTFEPGVNIRDDRDIMLTEDQLIGFIDQKVNN